MSAFNRRAMLRAGLAAGANLLTRRVAAAQAGSSLRLFLGGDLLGPYDAAADFAFPPFGRVADLIRNADVAFANAEGNVFDLVGFRGYRAAENGGGYPRLSVRSARALRASGLNLLSRANNHAMDWGDAGLRASTATLSRLGFAYAGAGDDLAEARRPVVLETARGRVALVAAASTFPGLSPAGDSTPGTGPRPGVSPLHVEPVTLVNEAEMSALIAIANRIGWQGYDLPGPDAKELRIEDKLFRLAPQPGRSWEMSAADRKALIASVAEARTKADLVIFSIHAHETFSGGYEDPTPADFLQPLFRELIEAGADIIIRHGPHTVQGLEIYRGKPIFYGMGSLFLDLPRTLTIASEGPESARQVVDLPAPWFEGAVATTRFEGRTLRELAFHPLVFSTAPGPTRGFPMQAGPADAPRILAMIAERSRAFGTQFRTEGAKLVLV